LRSTLLIRSSSAWPRFSTARHSDAERIAHSRRSGLEPCGCGPATINGELRTAPGATRRTSPPANREPGPGRTPANQRWTAATYRYDTLRRAARDRRPSETKRPESTLRRRSGRGPNAPINAAHVLADCRHWFCHVACCQR
jgi:hypothetical protein